MDITPLVPKNHNVINGYGSNGFKINETIYCNTILLTPNQIVEIKINQFEEIFLIDLKSILKSSSKWEPEILVIGTGRNHQIISSDLKNKIKKQYPEISINEMSTASACRTYNILMAEGRNVLAILTSIV